MIWRFTLIGPDGTETEIDEPVGWDALSMVLQRDPDWHGVSPTFSINDLHFHDEGYFILKEAYDARGIDGNIGIRIEWQCDDCTGESLVRIPPTNIISGLHGNLKFSAVNYSNSSFRSALASIPIYVMRWPGGEDAQTFDWEDGQDDDDTGQVNTLEQLKLLVDEANCEVSFVLNICTKTLDNQIAMLRHARDIGLLVNRVELGNEVNNTGSLGHTIYPDADTYADAMAPWMAAIKAEFPGVKVYFVGENKSWDGARDWNDKMIAKNPDGLIWHEGIQPTDYIGEDGNVDVGLLNSLIEAHWITAGFNLVNIPVQATEFNYKFDIHDPPLTDQQIFDTAYYMLKKISSLIGPTGGRSQPHLMCLRGAAGNQPAVNDSTFELTPIGLALRQFNLESSTIESDSEDATEACMKTFFEGKIDFGRYDEECGEDCYVIAGIEDLSPQTLLKNRQDTDVDLTSNIAYDGATELTDYTELGVDIQLPSKAIQIRDQAHESAPLNSANFTESTEWVDNTFGSPNQLRACIVIGFDTIVYTDIASSFLSPTTEIIAGGSNGEPAPGLTPTIDMERIATNLNCSSNEAEATYRIKGTLVNSGGTYFDFPKLQLIRLPAGLDPTVSANYQTLNSTTLPISGAFDVTITSLPITLNEGDKLWLHIFIFVNTAADWTTFYVNLDIETMIDISLTSTCDPTPCKTFLIHEAASRVIENITNNTLKFKSAYFGRTDSQPYAFDADGCGGLRSICNGLNIRRAILPDSSEPKVFTSWKDILQSLNACDLIGFDVNGSDVRTEPVRFFYDDTVVFVADGVNAYSKKIKTDRIWNQFNFGFEKFETESTNGLDAIHTKRQYRIPIENIDTALERLCKFIMDGYAIEVTRRKFGTTDDWRYDQDIFMLCLKRNESDLEVEQGNITDPANMFDPSTVINYRLTPIRQALRWFNWIMQGKRPIDAASTQMLFNSGEGNYVAKGLLDSLSCVLEVAAIAENDPLFENAFADINEAKPFIVPEEVTFTFPLGLNEFLYLKENIYGLIQYRRFPEEDWQFGWITKLEPHHEDGDATFTLITAVGGVAVENPPIYIIEETGPVITTEGGQGLIIE